MVLNQMPSFGLVNTPVGGVRKVVAEHETLSKCLHENADGLRLSLSYETC